MSALTYDKNGNVLGTPSDLSPTKQSSTPDTSVIQAKIKNSAQHYGVDPNLALAVAKQESSFNPTATSKAGAQGVMQLMPETAKNYGVTDPFNADQNIDAGTRYLADLQKKHNSDKAKMLIEYNSGPNNVNKDFQDLPTETQSYLTNILGPGARSQSGPIVYDKNGNPLNSQQGSGPAPKFPGLTYKPHPQSADVAASALNSVMGNMLPIALGGAGEVFGGPAGQALGTGIGETLNRPLQTGSAPNWEDVKAGLESAGISAGLSGLTSLPGYLKNKFITSRLQKAGDILESARRDVSGGVPSGSTAVAQNALEARLAPSKSVETGAWNKVYQHATNNTVTVNLPNGQTVDVNGAVQISPQTQQYIQTIQQNIGNLVQKNPSIAQATNTLNNTIKSIVTDSKNGVSYLPFDAVKQLRTDIGKLVSQEKNLNIAAPGKSIGVQRGTGIVSALKNNLDTDLDDTLANWSIANPQVMRDFENANLSTKSRVKASVFDKLVQGNIDHNTGTLNIPNVIQQLSNETSPVFKSFSATERKNLVDSFNALRNVSPAFGGSMSMKGSDYVIASAISTAHPFYAIRLAAHDLAKGVFENPKYAQIMKQLPSAPASSAQGKTLVKSFMKGALKGMPADLITPSGMVVKGHIDQNGEPQPDFKMQ